MKSTTAVIVPAIVFDSGGLLELMEAEGVTSMLLVPAEWLAVCDDPTLPWHDLSRVRAIG
jgi:fatty-acyl-CoA synthase